VRGVVRNVALRKLDIDRASRPLNRVEKMKVVHFVLRELNTLRRYHN
jgi:hypothetical protein